MEQVRAVGCLEPFLGTADQGTRQVAGELGDLDRHTACALVDGLCPGVGITMVAVALDENEAGHRFQTNQAGLA